jgi:hypothetical protein
MDTVTWLNTKPVLLINSQVLQILNAFSIPLRQHPRFNKESPLQPQPIFHL